MKQTEQDDDLMAIVFTNPETGMQETITPLGDEGLTLDGMGGGERRWRLAVTQNSEDERCPNQPTGTLFLLKSNFALDEENGKGVKESETLILGEQVEEAFLLGVTETRAYFSSPYGSGDGKPDCKSANAKRPDPEYVEKGAAPAPFCVGKNAKGRTVPVCPLADWSTDSKGGRIPPPCAYAVKVGFAIQTEDGFMSFDAYFKRSAETAGKLLYRDAGTAKARGLQPFQFAVKLFSTKQEKKQGRALGAKMDTLKPVNMDADTLAQLELLSAQWSADQIAYVARVRSLSLSAPAQSLQIPAQVDPFAHIPDRQVEEAVIVNPDEPLV